MILGSFWLELRGLGLAHGGNLFEIASFGEFSCLGLGLGCLFCNLTCFWWLGGVLLIWCFGFVFGLVNLLFCVESCCLGVM